MNARERGILIGLAVVLAAGSVFVVLNRTGGGGDSATGAPVSPEGWDLSRLPNPGAPVRTFTTPGNVLVQVIEEGTGDPVAKGQALDVDYTAYVPDRRSPVGRGVQRGVVLQKTKNFPGLIEGLADMRPGERRRLLIPSAMAFGSRRMGDLPPDADVVFDVEWTRLEVTDLQPGSGKVAQLGSKVLVHYKGSLENGTEFESSYGKGEPVEFPLKAGGLIEGWIQGIPGMREGGIRKLSIPWYLAYGSRGQPPKIGPYANLVFVVELLGVD